MNATARIIAAAALLGGLSLSTLPGVRADIGPRRPIQRVEVDAPEKYLAMRDETVSVTIDPQRIAHVEARFHFENTQPGWRETLVMRLGFPELTADAPLRDFAVAQCVHDRGVSPPRLEPVSVLTPQTAGSGPTDTLKATWKTWPLVFQGHEGAPSREDVTARVTYTQKLTPLANKTWRYTYVLRSGAPWVDPIGTADIKVTVNGAKVVSVSPKGATVKGNVVSWSLKSFEPSEDVVIVVR